MNKIKWVLCHGWWFPHCCTQLCRFPKTNSCLREQNWVLAFMCCLKLNVTEAPDVVVMWPRVSLACILSRVQARSTKKKTLWEYTTHTCLHTQMHPHPHPPMGKTERGVLRTWFMTANTPTVDPLKVQPPRRRAARVNRQPWTEIRKLELRGKAEIRSGPDETTFTGNT